MKYINGSNVIQRSNTNVTALNKFAIVFNPVYCGALVRAFYVTILRRVKSEFLNGALLHDFMVRQQLIQLQTETLLYFCMMQTSITLEFNYPNDTI